MATGTTHKISLYRKQRDFVTCTAPEVLYDGGYAAGKTRALCAKIYWQAMHPGALVGLTRKTFTSLRQNTLRTLLFPESGLPPILAPGSYTYNKQEQIISLHNGGQIYIFGCDDPERVGGVNFSAVGVDEAVELDEDEWCRLMACIRNKTSRCLQIFAVTNPGLPSHFLHERFVRLPPEATEAEKREFAKRARFSTTYHDLEDASGVCALPTTTIHLLESFTGQRRARYVDGVWCAFEGLVYNFRRDVHAIRRSGPWHEVVCGVDIGYRNPAAFVLIGVDGDGRTHQFHEFYAATQTPSDLIAELDRLCRPQKGEFDDETWTWGTQQEGHWTSGVQRIIIDPSEAGFIAELRRHFDANGLGEVSITGGNNDRKSGMRACQDQIRVGGDGRPRHTIDPSCEATWREAESYEIDPKTDLPVKEHDHAMDAWRYANMALQASGVEAGACAVEFVSAEDDSDDEGWEAI